MSKIPSDALEGLMRKVFVDKKLQPGLFWDAVMKSSLFVPLAKTKESSLALKKDQDDVLLQLGEGPGGVVLWIFTSPAVLKEYTQQDFSYIELPGQEMFEKIKGTSYPVVLIGPNSLTLSLDSRLVEQLSQGQVPMPPEEELKDVPKKTKVKVGEPQEDTSDLEERFGSLFEIHPEVLEASFIEVEDDQAPRLLLGLRLQDESREKLKEITGFLAKAAEGVLDKGKTMDVTLINGSLKGAFDKYGKRFYHKEQ